MLAFCLPRVDVFCPGHIAWCWFRSSSGAVRSCSVAFRLFDSSSFSHACAANGFDIECADVELRSFDSALALLYKQRCSITMPTCHLNRGKLPGLTSMPCFGYVTETLCANCCSQVGVN